MKTYPLPPKIGDAQQQLKAAEAALIKAISEHYPVGSIIGCVLGNATITARVRYIPDLQPYIGTLTVENIKTGATRRVNVTSTWRNIRLITRADDFEHQTQPAATETA